MRRKEKQKYNKVLQNLKSGAAIDVNLHWSSIGNKEAMEIAKYLQFATKLNSLNLSQNQIVRDGGMAIGNALKQEPFPYLRKLDFSNNDIGVKGGKVMGEVLAVNTNLTYLNLDSTALRKSGCWSIINGLETNFTLKVLILEATVVNQEMGKKLGSILTTNSSLEKLGLYMNAIGTHGAVAIAKALESNCSLGYLELGSNYIGVNGAKAFGHALKFNTSLYHLGLETNQLEEYGGKAILNGMRYNYSLTTIEIDHTDIDELTCESIQKITKRNQKIVSVFAEKFKAAHEENKGNIIFTVKSLNYLILTQKAIIAQETDTVKKEYLRQQIAQYCSKEYYIENFFKLAGICKEFQKGSEGSSLCVLGHELTKLVISYIPIEDYGPALAGDDATVTD